MKVFVIDISGKVPLYDYALCEELQTFCDVTMVTHRWPSARYTGRRMGLLRFIPKKRKIGKGKIKRLVKALEGLLNYLIMLVRILFSRPDVLHFQWLPFNEFCGVDNMYMALLKRLRPKMRIVYTIHNVFPHDMSAAAMEVYRRRMTSTARMVDHCIVHTESTKGDVVREFGLDPDSVSVISHGIFRPNYKAKTASVSGCNIILYGAITPYKGADILLDAVHLLPPKYRQQVKITIAGKAAADYVEVLRIKAEGLRADIIPVFIPDTELYQMIDSADLIALPYRAISQSGVLLLALHFRRPLILSDLPSFRETLRGFTDDMFFQPDSAESLSRLIIRYIDGEIDRKYQLQIIEQLNKVYSWVTSAEKTFELYKTVSISS